MIAQIGDESEHEVAVVEQDAAQVEPILLARCSLGGSQRVLAVIIIVMIDFDWHCWHRWRCWNSIAGDRRVVTVCVAVDGNGGGSG